MASEGLECSICCEHFDDKELCPRLLGCGHSFCSGCLEKLLRDKGIICPTCRSTVCVPAGIAGLPKNFALLDIILATPQHVGDESLHVCEACDDKQHSATSCCLDCKEDMCKDAARWHTRNKATRDHRVVSLGELKANPKLAAESVFCPEHNEQFRFFDEECNTVICRDCATLEHNGHKCLSLAEAASKYRQEMQALANKAITRAEEIKAAEARVIGVGLDLKKAHEKQAAQIECTFKELHEALTVREQVLMNELDQLHKTKEFTLTEQQDRLRIFQACLQSTVQRVLSTVQSPSHTELLVARSDTVATLGALERQPLVLEPQADCVLEFTVDHEQLLDVLNSAGIVSDKSTCASTTTAEGSAGVKHVQVCKEASAHDVQKRQRGGDLFVVELKEELGVSKTELKRSEKRWVKPWKVSKAETEEEKKTEALYCNVRRILNRVTPQTFQTFTQQMIDLDIDTPERLEGTVDLIFEKAINEASSVVYANLCRCLIPKKIVVKKDGIKKDVTFRKILLNRCQKEFEKNTPVERRIHEKLEALTEEGLSEEDLQIKKRELLDEAHQSKRRALGNIRFIGELFKLKMLTERIMHECVVKLLKSNDEESFECVCKLLVTIGKDLDHVKAKPRIDQYCSQINKIIQARILSPRVSLLMQDVVCLRNNDWVPCREDNNPKAMYKQQENKLKKMQRGKMYRRADETWTTEGREPRNVRKNKKREIERRPVDSECHISLASAAKGYGGWASGNSGRTGAVGAGPSASAAAAAAATGSTAADSDNRPANRYSALFGERKLSAPARMSSGDSRCQEVRNTISVGGRWGPFPAQAERDMAVRAVRQPKVCTYDGGWVSPRPTPEAAAPAEVLTEVTTAAVQELTKEAMKKKSISIIDEYLNIRDVMEAAECLRELQSPSVHYVFVDVVFKHTMEKEVSDRNATGKLLHVLLRDGVLTAQEYLHGLDQIFECAEDIEIDIPQLWSYLGELMGPTVFDGYLNLEELFNRCVLKYVSKNNAAKLFAYMLQTATIDTSREDVSAILSRYDVTLNTFFENEEEAKQFAMDKDIEFALRQDNSSSQVTGSNSQHSARIQEELRTLILKRNARNEEVFGWIDKNVSAADTKESPFIRALVTVVCEEAMDREDGASSKCNIVKLKDRKHLLQKYIDCNTRLELQALYAVQALFVQLDHPPGFLQSYFDSLYDEEIITEESFHAWESSSDEEPGKGVAVTAVSVFFRW